MRERPLPNLDSNQTKTGALCLFLLLLYRVSPRRRHGSAAGRFPPATTCGKATGDEGRPSSRAGTGASEAPEQVTEQHSSSSPFEGQFVTRARGNYTSCQTLIHEKTTDS